MKTELPFALWAALLSLTASPLLGQENLETQLQIVSARLLHPADDKDFDSAVEAQGSSIAILKGAVQEVLAAKQWKKMTDEKSAISAKKRALKAISLALNFNDETILLYLTDAFDVTQELADVRGLSEVIVGDYYMRHQPERHVPAAMGLIMDFEPVRVRKCLVLAISVGDYAKMSAFEKRVFLRTWLIIDGKIAEDKAKSKEELLGSNPTAVHPKDHKERMNIFWNDLAKEINGK